jgi:LmbE family N-acetylglucosaminyl deacetylase
MTVAKHGSVLAVFAHPDDEVLCAAGTLALCAARGEHVALRCATRGEYGPIADEKLATPETLAHVREQELHQSCSALGVRDLKFFDLPDGGVGWAADEHGTLQEIVANIRQLRPRVIITFGPDGLYGHPDHSAIGALSTEARRLAADPHYVLPKHPKLAHHHVPRVFFPVWTCAFVRELLATFENAGETVRLWTLEPEQFVVPAAAITASVDVSSVLAQKLRSLHSHRTQFGVDNVLARLSGPLALRFLGSEHFRCADHLSGGPLG